MHDLSLGSVTTRLPYPQILSTLVWCCPAWFECYERRKLDIKEFKWLPIETGSLDQLKSSLRLLQSHDEQRSTCWSCCSLKMPEREQNFHSKLCQNQVTHTVPIPSAMSRRQPGPSVFFLPEKLRFCSTIQTPQVFWGRNLRIVMDSHGYSIFWNLMIYYDILYLDRFLVLDYWTSFLWRGWCAKPLSSPH